MSWGDYAQWAAFALSLGVVLFTGGQRLMRKEFVTPAELAGLVKALTDEDRANHDDIRDVRHRVEMAEQKLKSMPDYDTVNRLKDVCAELNAAVREMRAEVRGLDEKVDNQGTAVLRIEQHLLSKVA
jgi:predicted  nucleic acid-binding Zn-ribbon protein